MHHTTALTTLTLLAAAALSTAQDTAQYTTSNPLLQPPRPSIDTATIPTGSIPIESLPIFTIPEGTTPGPDPVPTATREVVTAAGCIPPGEQVFSIQTDTVIRTDPITFTPECGSEPTGTENAVTGSITTQGPIVTGGGGNATSGAPFTNGTMNGPSTVMSTTLVTSTLDQSMTDEDGATATTGADGAETGAATTEDGGDTTDASGAAVQTGNVGARAAVGGGLAGVLGAVAGVMML